jgi:hypothetical protein
LVGQLLTIADKRLAEFVCSLVKSTMTRDDARVIWCRRGDFAGVFVGSNPRQPTISRTPRRVGGDWPTFDGHVVLLFDGRSYAKRPLTLVASDRGTH